MTDLQRRRFIANSAAVAAGSVTAGVVSAPRHEAKAQASAGTSANSTAFASNWNQCPNRIWLGADYWANPLQDWRISAGRIECTNPAVNRSVHLLTRQLGDQAGEFKMSVRIGRVGKKLADGRGSCGFQIGTRGPLNEYRNSLIFGSGLNCGMTAEGALFIGNPQSAAKQKIDLARDAVELRLHAAPNGNKYSVTVSAHDVTTSEELGRHTRNDLSPGQLVGNVALVSNFGTPRRGRRANQNQGGPGTGLFWFADWQIDGSKLTAHNDRAFGPILFSQYTLSRQVLKLTAQMPPIGPKDSQTVRLLVDRGAGWKLLGEETIHPDARTATFRIEDWDDTRDTPYRLEYTTTAKNQPNGVHTWDGLIRRDPVDKPVISVADISCNIHAAFPNHEYVANLAKLDPDLLAFTGDQFYESTGGFGVVRNPVDKAIVDYLRKWAMHGWTWRELLRDRPSISIPDDHDVYQGNIWGKAGAPQETTQEAGGYQMDAQWVNVVHRTQTSHHPDAHDPTPAQQDISVYHGPMTYGRISFAVLADRMFKTAPEGVVPPTDSRADHVVDPNFDPKTADLPGLDLLGDRQMKFLADWVTDWRGADMKAVLSQTIFTAMATTHGGNREVLRADYDTNGWPQTARNEALKLIRKAFAVHLAGDQHLPAVVHYGIDEYRDAGIAFAGPAVNVGYPRWWEPTEEGKNRAPGAPKISGDFVDHFGNLMTVVAVKNGEVAPQGSVLEVMEQKASGLGVVYFDKAQRKISIHCWPYLADPTASGTQFPGWPVEFPVVENYARRATAFLPTLNIKGIANPVVHVVDEATGETVYSLRIAGTTFQPHVFATGKYTVRIEDPDVGQSKTVTGMTATAKNQHVVEIQV